MKRHEKKQRPKKWMGGLEFVAVYLAGKRLGMSTDVLRCLFCCGEKPRNHSVLSKQLDQQENMRTARFTNHM